jgi:hypothetical protein
MRLARYMAHGRQERCSRGFWWGNLRERDHFEDLAVDSKITLKWVFKKCDREHGLD